MSESITIQRGNTTVKRSRNLRGILDCARKEPVTRVYVTSLPKGRARVFFVFFDGADSTTFWESETVVHNWLQSRRSWGKPIDIIVDTGMGVTVYDYVGDFREKQKRV